MKVSRPRGENACVPPPGRIPSMMTAQPPSGANQVAVSGVLDGPGRAPRRHDRVAWAALERAVGRRAAGDADAVSTLGAALGDHEIPLAVVNIQVRGLGELQSGAGPQRPRGGQGYAGLQVDSDLQDPAVL